MALFGGCSAGTGQACAHLWRLLEACVCLLLLPLPAARSTALCPSLCVMVSVCRRRGMGWTEGKAIGRKAKEEAKAKELVR